MAAGSWRRYALTLLAVLLHLASAANGEEANDTSKPFFFGFEEDAHEHKHQNPLRSLFGAFTASTTTTTPLPTTQSTTPSPPTTSSSLYSPDRTSNLHTSNLLWSQQAHAPNVIPHYPMLAAYQPAFSPQYPVYPGQMHLGYHPLPLYPFPLVPEMANQTRQDKALFRFLSNFLSRSIFAKRATATLSNNDIDGVVSFSQLTPFTSVVAVVTVTNLSPNTNYRITVRQNYDTSFLCGFQYDIFNPNQVELGGVVGEVQTDSHGSINQEMLSVTPDRVTLFGFLSIVLSRSLRLEDLNGNIVSCGRVYPS